MINYGESISNNSPNEDNSAERDNISLQQSKETKLLLRKSYFKSPKTNWIQEKFSIAIKGKDKEAFSNYYEKKCLDRRKKGEFQMSIQDIKKHQKIAVLFSNKTIKSKSLIKKFALCYWKNKIKKLEMEENPLNEKNQNALNEINQIPSNKSKQVPLCLKNQKEKLEHQKVKNERNNKQIYFENN